MFDERKPIGLRALSLFHVALPPTLLWTLRRFGYDRRALGLQTLLVSALLPLTYALTAPEKNINWVFGPGAEPQHRLPRPLYLALEMIALPTVSMLPTHAILKRIFNPPRDFAMQASVLSRPATAAAGTEGGLGRFRIGTQFPSGGADGQEAATPQGQEGHARVQGGPAPQRPFRAQGEEPAPGGRDRHVGIGPVAAEEDGQAEIHLDPAHERDAEEHRAEKHFPQEHTPQEHGGPQAHHRRHAQDDAEDHREAPQHAREILLARDEAYDQQTAKREVLKPRGRACRT
jgi:hypothetical protein